MIIDFKVYENGNLLEESQDRCNAFKVEIDRSSMDSDGWIDSEYDVVFTKRTPVVGAHQNSYPKTYTVISKDDSLVESTNTITIWVNFISKIQ